MLFADTNKIFDLLIDNMDC